MLNEIENWRATSLNINCTPPTKYEILKTIEMVKKNKMLGPENISVEFYKTDPKL